MTTIKLKNGSGAPTSGDLTQGEPALDLTNKRLYTEDSGGTVIEVGTNPGVDVTFADDRKAIFGAGSDLQIYHDGFNSYVQDAGDGALILNTTNGGGVYVYSAGETMATFNSNGAVNLYHDNAAKLATTATGIDVTGTVSADGLTVDGAATFTTADNTAQVALVSTDADASDGPILEMFRNSSSPADDDDLGIIKFFGENDASEKIEYGIIEVKAVDVSDGAEDGSINLTAMLNGTARSRLFSNSTETVLNEGSQDIDFRVESDNNSHALFVQGSDGSVGINTTNFVTTGAKLQVKGTSAAPSVGASNFEGSIFSVEGTSTVNISMGTTGASGYNGWIQVHDAGTGTNYGLNLNPLGGSVGIGTDSPASQDASANNLVISDTAGNGGLTINTPTNAIGAIHFSDGTSGADRYRGIISYGHSDNSMRFHTNTARAMTIDSSGNLLVGKTGTGIGTVGVEAKADGQLWATRDGNPVLSLNRETSNGSIAAFYKDGTTVGSIGTNSSLPYFAGTSIGLKISGTQIRPSNSTGNNNDNAVDLGKSDTRFKDLYLSGGAYLGGTGSANKLDDYEEGTWTPTLEASTTNPTPTAVTVNNATYTKVGRMVHIQAYITVNLTSTGSGGAQITGLPFTVGTGYAPVQFVHGDLILSNGGYFNNSSTKIIAITNNSTSSIGYAGTGTKGLMISGTYEVA